MSENNMIKGSNRISNFENSIIYKLNNTKNVTVTKNAWEVGEKHLDLFTERNTELPQAEPIKSDKDFERLDKYLNLSDDEKLLLKVYLITCFNPQIAYPTVCIKGEIGNGKTVLASILKDLIDPSVYKSHSIGELAQNDLETLMTDNYFTVFDNVYQLSQKANDMFCMAITGAFLSRKAYSNNEVNHINTRLCFTGEPDFLEYSDISSRMITFNMKPLGQSAVSYNALCNSIKADLPYILGGIFDILSNALDIQQHIEIKEPIRLYDFHKFGYAVAEAMGGYGDRFTEILKNHIGRV